MDIFLSYASEDRELADQIHLALAGGGHHVFFDKSSLPPAGDYHMRIAAAVEQSDLFVFLMSSSSLSQGSYALSELKLARTKWPHPKDRVLPVWVKKADWESVPPYLKAVTVLEPEGSVPAEVLAAVSRMASAVTGDSNELNRDRSWTIRKIVGTRYMQVALLGLIAVIGIALVINWQERPAANPHPVSQLSQSQASQPAASRENTAETVAIAAQAAAEKTRIAEETRKDATRYWRKAWVAIHDRHQLAYPRDPWGNNYANRNELLKMLDRVDVRRDKKLNGLKFKIVTNLKNAPHGNTGSSTAYISTYYDIYYGGALSGDLDELEFQIRAMAVEYDVEGVVPNEQGAN